MWTVGVYTQGMMGRTPNIASIAKQGALFSDHYAQPSCTAGRAAFIAGQLPIRTGMTTIGIPGSPGGIQKEDPTLAEVLKSQGYVTGQFMKNHLGDRNEFLPTVHGFDEWFGNLDHLNAEEEPEQLDYPGQNNPAYTKKYGPRGVPHAWATDEDDPTTDAVFGRVGKQRGSPVRRPNCWLARKWGTPPTRRISTAITTWITGRVRPINPPAASISTATKPISWRSGWTAGKCTSASSLRAVGGTRSISPVFPACSIC